MASQVARAGWRALPTALAVACLGLFVRAEGPQAPARPAAAPTQAQTPAPQTPVFKATVDLVPVDVIVTDLDGTPIRGLTADDFAIYDRGKPQTIAAFEEVSREGGSKAAAIPASVRHDVADNRTAQSQRLVVVVVDDLHIFRGRTDKAKDLTKQVIDALGADASMALLFTSGDHSTEVTEDRSVLLAAADTLKGRQAIRRPHDANDNQAAKGLDPEMSNDQIRAAINAVGSSEDFFDNMAQYKTLEDAARVIGGSDLRRKAFVLISEGINKDLTGIFTGTSTPCDLAPTPTPGSTAPAATGGRRGRGASSPTPTNSLPAPCYHDDALRRAAEAMRRSNVTMYAVDPRGHLTDQELAIEGFGSTKGLVTSPTGRATDEDSPFRMTNGIRLAQEGLTDMSSATGGFAVTDSDDFAGGIERIQSDLDHFYLIGFRPADSGGSDSYRPLDVKIAAHPDYVLRFRTGYTPGGPPELPKNADPLLSAALPNTDVPLRLFAEAFPSTPPPAPQTGTIITAPPAPAIERGARVGVALEVASPTAVLSETDGKLHDDVTYKIFAVNTTNGKVLSHMSRDAQLVLKPIASARGPAPATVMYQVQTAFDLAPGTYQLRASASSTKLASGGSVYLPIEVPDFSKPALAVSGLVVGYADGERIPIAPAPAAAGPGESPEPPPLPMPFAPTLDRQFRQSDTLRVFCQVRRASALDPLHVDVELATASGTTVSSSTYEFGPSADETVAATIVPVEHRLSLADVPAGAYRLRVVATHGGTSVRQEIGIGVR